MISVISSTGSTREAFTPWEAPKRLANASFSSSTSTAISGWASTTSAAETAHMPMPPTP